MVRGIVVRGDDVSVSRAAVTGFALLLHEFATNAVKYGALSSPSGDLDLECLNRGDVLELIWTERGGPSVVPASTEGFGTKLGKLTIEKQFGGEIIRLWHSDGLVIRLSVPRGNRLPDLSWIGRMST